LQTAIESWPVGAIDPLVAIEATTGYCLAAKGEPERAEAHFERALAACRAIGHRYHERWIERARDRVMPKRRASSATSLPVRDLHDVAMLMTDVAAILGAGHSIDLLAHRAADILRRTPLGPRIDVAVETGLPYASLPSSSWDSGADGTSVLGLRGSDRRVTITCRDVRALDEIALTKSVADVVRVAVNRTADTSEGDDQHLWPCGPADADDDTIFQSPRMTELVKIASRLAATKLPILLTGETGTGKDILARLIHDHSQVKHGPFVPFNCAAIQRELVESQLFGHRRGAFTGAVDSLPGLVRAAERGTLFIDELGDMDLSVQPKLLRFLENGEILPLGESRAHRVDARIVAATNAELEDLVDQGRFRRDLFYRIGAARIALPPLRERKDEIPALASLFLRRFSIECRRSGLRMGDDFIAALLLFEWPGNIRQLANEMRRVIAMAPDGATLAASDLAPEIVRAWNARAPMVAVAAHPAVQIRLDQPLALAIQDLEQKFIAHALDLSGGRVAEAARMLGLSRKGLFLKRRRRGLTRRVAESA
jgi:DNA-binding NtrC family response regulator